METVTKRTTCSRDCPDACGLLVDIRSNEIIGLRGDPDHPVTRGFLCFRTSRFPSIQTAKNRVSTALVRSGTGFESVALDEALDLVAARLTRIRAESGPAAIFHYRSGGSLGLLKQVADRFFEAFGPCTTKIGDICSGAGEAAQLADFGRCDSNDFFDLAHSANVLIWGKNPFVSNVHLVPLLRQARERGAGLTLIDPVHHRGASLCDRYVQPRPGSDLELAFAVARVLVDRGAVDPSRCENAEEFLARVQAHDVPAWAALADVPVPHVEAIADALQNGPTAILVGWGMQRRERGGAIVRALDALSALSGNLFVPGGGCSFYYQRRGAFAPIHTGAAARHVREPMFGADVLAAQDPPIRAIWVTAGNPVAMLPDSQRVAEAFDRTEFVVVVDPLMTDTARRADVVLPCPTMLEDDDLLGAFGHHWISESRPVLDPPPGVVHELELFQRLASRVGLGDEFAGSVDDWKRKLLANVAKDGLDLETLRENGGAARPTHIPETALGSDAIPTPSGKVELITAVPPPPPVDEEFPLWLFSNSSKDSQSSVWSTEPFDYLPVTVHPDVAAAAGVAAGDVAVLESRVGAIEVVVDTSADQRHDVAIVPKGGHFDRGQAANSLVEARTTDIGLGGAYLDCHVRLRPA